MTDWPPRPLLSRTYYKAHGLGNDYLVFEEGQDWIASPENIEWVCRRHRGIGSDGIVVLLDKEDIGLDGADTAPASEEAPTFGEAAVSGEARVSLRMFNPDGGEFERSGNGLRIAASYLARSRPALTRVVAEVGGSRVRMTVHQRSGPEYDISVAMGRAAIGESAVGLTPGTLGQAGGTIGRSGGTVGRRGDRGSGDGVGGELAGPDQEPLRVVPVSVGNPHLVVLLDSREMLTDSTLSRIGPFLAAHSALAHGANVQLAVPMKPGRCQALIWERGVGRTAASGTSACAVAVALVASELVEPGEVVVDMPGGNLHVSVTDSLEVVLRGPVEEVCEGRLTEAVLDQMR